MKVTECLNTEHGVFLLQLDTLKKMIDEKATLPELKAAVRVIGVAVEKHRDVEDKYLYPAIIRECGKEFPPIRVMEQEHEQITECIKKIESNSLKNYDPIKKFITILEEHIQKEIKVLFPMAEETISKEELEEIACLCSLHSHQKNETHHVSCCGGCSHKE